jgi:hypothetical protein
VLSCGRGVSMRPDIGAVIELAASLFRSCSTSSRLSLSLSTPPLPLPLSLSLFVLTDLQSFVDCQRNFSHLACRWRAPGAARRRGGGLTGAPEKRVMQRSSAAWTRGLMGRSKRAFLNLSHQMRAQGSSFPLLLVLLLHPFLASKFALDDKATQVILAPIM